MGVGWGGGGGGFGGNCLYVNLCGVIYLALKNMCCCLEPLRFTALL